MKHLLLEIEVTDKGQEIGERVGWLLEDVLFNHIKNCTDKASEQDIFGTAYPKIRVLTEEQPV